MTEINQNLIELLRELLNRLENKEKTKKENDIYRIANSLWLLLWKYKGQL